MPQSVYGWFSWVTMFAISVLITWRGRGWVRMCAVMLLVDHLALPFIRDPGQWTDPIKPRLAIDLAQLAVCLTAAAASGNVRLAALAAFGVLDVATNFAKIPVRGLVGPVVFVTTVQVWDWGAYAAIIWAFLGGRSKGSS